MARMSAAAQWTSEREQIEREQENKKQIGFDFPCSTAGILDETE